MLKKLKLDSNTISFLKHGKNYLSASLLTKGLSLISIPVMTRLLSPSDYGILAVFMSLAGILGIFFGFGIRGAISRYFYENTQDFDRFFSTNLFFVNLLGIILSIFLYLFRVEISILMNIPVSLVLFAIVVAFISTSYTLVQAYL
jgi:O-antigen/teichoic acid export membrane protein